MKTDRKDSTGLALQREASGSTKNMRLRNTGAEFLKANLTGCVTRGIFLRTTKLNRGTSYCLLMVFIVLEKAYCYVIEFLIFYLLILKILPVTFFRVSEAEFLALKTLTGTCLCFEISHRDTYLPYSTSGTILRNSEGFYRSKNLYFYFSLRPVSIKI